MYHTGLSDHNVMFVRQCPVELIVKMLGLWTHQKYLISLETCLAIQLCVTLRVRMMDSAYRLVCVNAPMSGRETPVNKVEYN